MRETHVAESAIVTLRIAVKIMSDYSSPDGPRSKEVIDILREIDKVERRIGALADGRILAPPAPTKEG